MKYSYKAILKYYPKHYEANEKQEADRQIVYNCKNGVWNCEIVSRFRSEINLIKDKKASKYILASIPASTSSVSHRRFNNIINKLSVSCNVENGYNLIVNTKNTDSGHISGKKDNPTEFFHINKELCYGKSIILIDDVITRGITFEKTADLLIRNGAISVFGLFVAETASFEDMIDYEEMFNIQQESEIAEYEEFLEYVDNVPICEERGISPGCDRCGEETRWHNDSANEYICLNCGGISTISDQEKADFEEYDKNPEEFKTCYECGYPAKPFIHYGNKEWVCIKCHLML